jgi:putative membrane protein insertion efficiency factor
VIFRIRRAAASGSVRFALAAFFVLSVLFVLDVSQPPGRQRLGRGAVAAIHVYRRTLSPWMSYAGISCLFVPTCSHYAEAAIQKYGVVRGSWKSLGRIARCNPILTSVGTVDEP